LRKVLRLFFFFFVPALWASIFQQYLRLYSSGTASALCWFTLLYFSSYGSLAVLLYPTPFFRV
jgi:hypothetical protein